MDPVVRLIAIGDCFLIGSYKQFMIAAAAQREHKAASGISRYQLRRDCFKHPGVVRDLQFFLTVREHTYTHTHCHYEYCSKEDEQLITLLHLNYFLLLELLHPESSGHLMSSNKSIRTSCLWQLVQKNKCPFRSYSAKRAILIHHEASKRMVYTSSTFNLSLAEPSAEVHCVNPKSAGFLTKDHRLQVPSQSIAAPMASCLQTPYTQ